MLKRSFTVLPLLAILLTLLLLNTERGLDHADASHTGGMDRMSIDMDPGWLPANTNTSLGSQDVCGWINENNLLDAAEDAVDTIFVDITATNIPASSAITGYTYTLNGHPELHVVSQNSNGLLFANNAPPIDIQQSSDPLPDTDGSFHTTVLDPSTEPGEAESGSGVLDRLQISTSPIALPGVYPVTLSGAVHFDTSNNPHAPDSLQFAAIEVNSQCGNDYDGDGVPDTVDNCLFTANPSQANDDSDAWGDVCDNCPNDANSLQENNDGDALGDVCDPDDDNDTILDGVDNCQFASNTSQANFDSDALGDVCDPDDDNDGNPDTTDTDDDNDRVADIAEGPCGGATPSSLRPERLDGVFATVDDDGDTMTDEPLPGGSENFDGDGDGYRGDGPGAGNISEKRIYAAAGTANDQDPCGGSGWPADLATAGPSANRINLTDVSSFISGSPRKFGTDPGDAGYDVRWDLVTGNGAAPPKDISLTDLTNLTTLFPPMLGGVKAFGGPVCPWPP